MRTFSYLIAAAALWGAALAMGPVALIKTSVAEKQERQYSASESAVEAASNARRDCITEYGVLRLIGAGDLRKAEFRKEGEAVGFERHGDSFNYFTERNGTKTVLKTSYPAAQVFLKLEYPTDVPEEKAGGWVITEKLQREWTREFTEGMANLLPALKKCADQRQ